MVFGLPRYMYTYTFSKTFTKLFKISKPFTKTLRTWVDVFEFHWFESHGDLVYRKKHLNFYTNENEPLAPENTHLEKDIQNLETIIFTVYAIFPGCQILSICQPESQSF